jgi:transposase
MTGHLSIGDRWRVVSMRQDQGISSSHIARLINCSVQTVYNILELFYETNDVIERQGRGGGNSLIDTEIFILRQILYRYPYETSNQISNRFYQRTGTSVTSRTIRNYRTRLGFRSVHARIQPLLNQNHADNRLAFCRRYVNYDWNDVIFSDEKLFQVDTTGIVYYIPYGRRRPTTFRSQVKFKVTVFGAVWYNNKSNLVFIRGRTNTHTFVEYLDEALHSRRRWIRNYYFIHDRPTWAHTTTSH